MISIELQQEFPSIKRLNCKKGLPNKVIFFIYKNHDCHNGKEDLKEAF